MIIGVSLPSITDMYTVHCIRKARSIVGAPDLALGREQMSFAESNLHSRVHDQEAKAGAEAWRMSTAVPQLQGSSDIRQLHKMGRKRPPPRMPGDVLHGTLPRQAAAPAGKVVDTTSPGEPLKRVWPQNMKLSGVLHSNPIAKRRL
ncbi:hypothetical protein QTP70_021930 [Hemibagrus guttatus]|uniref:Uncharacterized protein n=1 Tax=Hemibagrus guttatus TaxID=175788 RepID=A0AAE0QBZ3_9TELE|nr:hypothetical protein QTP70_021930 [Hemibagrus guttatus]